MSKKNIILIFSILFLSSCGADKGDHTEVVCINTQHITVPAEQFPLFQIGGDVESIQDFTSSNGERMITVSGCDLSLIGDTTTNNIANDSNNIDDSNNPRDSNNARNF